MGPCLTDFNPDFGVVLFLLFFLGQYQSLKVPVGIPLPLKILLKGLLLGSKAFPHWIVNTFGLKSYYPVVVQTPLAFSCQMSVQLFRRL